MPIDQIKRIGSHEWDLYKGDLLRLEENFHEELRESERSKSKDYKKPGLLSVAYVRDCRVLGERYGLSVNELNNRKVKDIQSYERYGDKDVVYVCSASVDQSVQGEGIGYLLARAFRAFASSEGYRFIIGHAREGKPMRINEKLGAKPVKKYENWYKTKEDYLLYELDTMGQRFLKPKAQGDTFTCGPTSLKMVLDMYGVGADVGKLGKIMGTNSDRGSSPKMMVEAIKNIGFDAELVKEAKIEDINDQMKRGSPPIISWFSEYDSHYSPVDYLDMKNGKISLMDPDEGNFTVMDFDTFQKVWFSFPPPRLERPEDLRIRNMIVINK